MKNLKKLSPKALVFCNLSGYNIEMIKENLNSNVFALQRCETKKEINDNDVDSQYPYVVYNPLNLSVK